MIENDFKTLGDPRVRALRHKSAFAVDPHVLDISKRVFGQCCVRTTYMGVYVQFTWDNLGGAKATPSMNYLFHRRLLEWLSTSNLG